MDYVVNLETYRGPLDLLLYLVKRHEVDICDIPIAQVTEQFLEHMRVLELIDVERAGDFVVMAATLMEIKSKLLLPGEETTETEGADPRRELVKQLLEYKKYKDAAGLLEEHAERQASRLPRLPLELPTPRPSARPAVRAVELWDLVSAFGRIMRETMALQPQQIVADHTPIHIYMEQIHARLLREGRLSLADLFTPPLTRGRLLGLFLAILELIKGRKVVAEQDEVFGPIWIVPRDEPPEGDPGPIPAVDPPAEPNS